ncbi:hypothetical protein [Helicobacter brantae]|uniref:Uncharacterized protein n=1 Tax=Helicobacter brantae TaxID=375927 RepID=A0A3D8J1Y6_9HELI|nr:hypothetical protein [Helicobacter brantae]RDU71383.1 hypothetical protein CQA58_02225 [Helicobacter brantae]
MKKILLTSLGLATSLLAITQEQQIRLDSLFDQKEHNISQSNEFGAGEKQTLIQALKEEKARVEKMSDEEVEKFFEEEEETKKDKPLVLKKGEEWIGGVFGASGIRVSAFFGGNSGGAYMGYATIGPRYNITGEGFTMGIQEGFSLSAPIGLGFIKTTNGGYFALPIALEANYIFSGKFGISGGLRYTFSPQDIGNLHIMDFYAGFDLFYGIYLEAGYVFYSSQDVKIGNKTISTDPLSGAITFNVGWRF